MQVEQKMIVLMGADGNTVKVNKAVALQMGLVRDKIRNRIENDEPCILPGITKKTLDKVIEYCNYHSEPHSPTELKSFDAEFLKQVSPVDLFNLIQAAHHVKIQSLMDLTCQILGGMVKTKTFGQIMQDFIKHTKSPPRGLHNAFEGSTERLTLDKILRHRGKETYVKKADYATLTFAQFFTSCLSFVDRRGECFDHHVAKLLSSEDHEELSNSTEQLLNLLDGGVQGHLNSTAVHRLLWILNKYNGKMIQCEAVNILSRSQLLECEDVITNNAIPVLVKHMSDPFHELAVESVMGLMRIADAFPNWINVILNMHALEEALKIVKGAHGSLEFSRGLGKFLAVVCRYGIPSDKVELARDILEEFLNFENRFPILFTCHALQYLTYVNNVAIGKKTLHNLVQFTWCFSDLCYSKNVLVGGSALAVVGNIARGGKTDQIQCLLIDCNLLQRLRMIMDTGEEVYLVDALCVPLEMDESGVKMEAAWAIYNCIYRNRERHIDNYQGGSMVKPKFSAMSGF